MFGEWLAGIQMSFAGFMILYVLLLLALGTILDTHRSYPSWCRCCCRRSSCAHRAVLTEVWNVQPLGAGRAREPLPTIAAA